jgi:hypothetical protein
MGKDENYLYGLAAVDHAEQNQLHIMAGFSAFWDGLLLP